MLGELFNKVYAEGNCRCDLASHLAQALRTIHVVMATMRAMATVAIKVFNIIRVLIDQQVPRLKVPEYEPTHHTEEHNQHKGNHGGLSGEYKG